MNTYDHKHIKNIVLLGAPQVGKTLLAEDMLFEAGIIHRRGTIEGRNTVSDYHEIEHEREGSVFATPLHTEWQDFKINIIDTPGYDDFIGEVISAIRVADTCVMVVSAQHGVEIGTQIIWRYVEASDKPVIFSINQMDHPRANFENSLADLKNRFGKAVTQMQYPVSEGEGFTSIIDLLKMVMYKFNEQGGKPQKVSIPPAEMEKAKRLHNELIEKAAENDEQLMEKYFDKGFLSEDEMREGLKLGMIHRDVFPVFCMSARKNMGCGRMMGFIDNVAPLPHEARPESAHDGEELAFDPHQPLTVFVFKTQMDANVGSISFFKVITGEIKINDELVNSQTGTVEHIHQLFIMDGKNRNPIDRLVAGDIGATVKLKDTATNQTLHAKGFDISLSPMVYPTPRARTAVVALSKKDEEKLGTVLDKIHQEDPTFEVVYARELHQWIISAQGEMHLLVCKWLLDNVYKLKTEFVPPRISYRETIHKAASTNYRHRKQAGGQGQFAEIHLKVEPYFEGMPDPHEFPVHSKEVIELESGGKLVFYNCITKGEIDTGFIPAVLSGIMDTMADGPITGSYVQDVCVQLYDGKMHPSDSNDSAFRVAGMMAFNEAFMKAGPQLLEPLYNLKISIPEEMMSDVLVDLQTRRSLIVDMDTVDGYQIIQAKTPLAELDHFASALRALSQGRGTFHQQFAEYAPVSVEIQQKLAKKFSTLTLA